MTDKEKKAEEIIDKDFKEHEEEYKAKGVDKAKIRQLVKKLMYSAGAKVSKHRPNEKDYKANFKKKVAKRRKKNKAKRH